MKTRMEHDALGRIAVPAHRRWAAQTQRSLENFPIGEEKMPLALIHALALVKKTAAEVNHRLGVLDEKRSRLIIQVAEEVRTGLYDDEFPLSVWQTGSGTQTNMNVNEVIAHRCNELSEPGLVHPNDHVNCSQSSNDVFPTAMAIASVLALEEELIPAIEGLRRVMAEKSLHYRHLVKIGRTHLQDATPLTLGQEISGWEAMLENNLRMIRCGADEMKALAIGGTAVGTGLNAPEGFGAAVTVGISEATGKTFVEDTNKFHALTSHDRLVFSHGALKALAANLMKIANDIRWLASGPRCGIGELILPANEPGSSIMPGKVNPTQCEALSMIACQVMGNDTVIGLAASQGNFQLNVYMPVMIHNFLQSVRLLSDGVRSFTLRCAAGLTANETRIQEVVERSLMLVTALVPVIGYETAAQAALKAHQENLTLKEAVMNLHLMDESTYDELIQPAAMTGMT
ncbi:class II fumarate hydratase [Anoxynatronum buryatiense]|uniref:Fumarate hydratase class II n=1 Tax=Anoxynatronum buryatiense TaxID=489973 RepID=A0AA46AK57_9CLOT|nr:class II fumarate hydratase [Anoxynatronum buryatiense]SMP67889.1 fumarase, class II [Anoxynatronum buryatiense]